MNDENNENFSELVIEAKAAVQDLPQGHHGVALHQILQSCPLLHLLLGPGWVRVGVGPCEQGHTLGPHFGLL